MDEIVASIERGSSIDSARRVEVAMASVGTAVEGRNPLAPAHRAPNRERYHAHPRARMHTRTLMARKMNPNRHSICTPSTTAPSSAARPKHLKQDREAAHQRSG